MCEQILPVRFTPRCRTAAADLAVRLLPSDRSGRSFSISSSSGAASSRVRVTVYPDGSGQPGTFSQAALYFYLRGRDLREPKAQLRRLSELLKHGTTLAAEAGGAKVSSVSSAL